MSVEAFRKIVGGYESWEPSRAFADVVCLHEVSKLIRGEYRVGREEKQECGDPKCVTLKRHSEFRMEVVAGPCDSDMSRETLDGMVEGELVAAYKDADPTGRGGVTGRFKWDGAASALVGRTFAVLNAGTHHDPLRDCEECHTPHHAEGWLRAAIVDGHNEGCRVAASIAYNFDPSGDGSAGEFIGTIEGVLTCQCA